MPLKDFSGLFRGHEAQNDAEPGKGTGDCIIVLLLSSQDTTESSRGRINVKGVIHIQRDIEKAPRLNYIRSNECMS